MNRYRLLGCTITTDMPLPGMIALDESSGPQEEGVIVVDLTPDAQAATEVDWRHDWRAPDGELLLQLGGNGGRHFLRFPEQADFEIRTRPPRIAVRSESVGSSTVGRLLMNQVLPRLLAHRGGLLLHASAVELPAGVVAFAGQTCAGKSTLAAAFGARGRRVVTDDALAVRWNDGVPHAFGCRASLRLRPDSSRALGSPEAPDPKLPVAICRDGAERSESAPLVAVVALKPHPPSDSLAAPATSPLASTATPDRIRLTALSPGRALLELITHSFQLDPLDLELARRRLPMLSDLVERIPILALEYRHDWRALDQVCELLARTGHSAASLRDLVDG